MSTSRSGSPTGTCGPFEPDHPHLQALHDALSTKTLPCSSGIFSVQPKDLILYYGDNDGPNSKGLGRIDFTSLTDAQMQHLAESCDAATFGRGGKDVYDESYRKAGKLDTRHFCASFCPELSGLMHLIRYNILEGHTGKGLKIELYKLNVYGPGSFFKAHKDTPRADNMIASLVVVLPTRHSGGALVFRHKAREFKFDSGKMLSEANIPSIAYAAFYGDVEHEVEPVESGYRVTLTYNLYLVDALTTEVPQDSAYELALKDAFRALLADEHYLPDGGLIGFGLRHEYPVDLRSVRLDRDKDEQELVPVEHLLGTLKGSDAVLHKVCADLGLRAVLHILYFDTSMSEVSVVMCPSVAPWDERECMQRFTSRAQKNQDGIYIVMDGEEYPDEVVHWATRIRPLDVKMLATPYLAYGNESYMEMIYSTFCLVVDIDSVRRRRRLGLLPFN